MRVLKSNLFGIISKFTSRYRYIQENKYCSPPTCEERGSGIDKVINAIELYQLPAPDFIELEENMKVVLYSLKKLSEMDKEDKIRACYQYACLKHVSNEKMTNATLRKRFNISGGNYPVASKVISETIARGLIKLADPSSKSKKYAVYVPYWT